MIIISAISTLLMAGAGAANAVMDTLAHHYSTSIFSKMDTTFWNPMESWRRKWKNGDHKQGEAFLFSSTLLVFTTDAWHLFKFIMLNAFTLAAVLPCWKLLGVSAWYLIPLFAGFKIVFSATFNFLYHKKLLIPRYPMIKNETRKRN